MNETSGKRKKVFVAGLDGVPQTLLADLTDDGEMPNLQKILSSGYRLHQMDASIPEVSSTSWTSFYTGVNPGEHGIYGFMELKPGTYDLKFPGQMDVKAPSLWEIAGRDLKGKSSTLSDKYAEAITAPLRSIVMNIPQTYPAVPMNGILSAGFVCPDLKKGTFPDEVYGYLTSIGYMQDVDAQLAATDPPAFFDEIRRSLEKRSEAYEQLMLSEQWDLFIGVITETDRLHHFFFDAAYDKGHCHYGTFHEIYKTIDDIIGRLYNRFMDLTDGEGFFLTMSDHGFTEIRSEVYLNRWLLNNNFLNLADGRDFFNQIETGTKAFALDPSRLYVNIEGKYPRGTVREPEREAVTRDLKDALTGLTDEAGTPVIKAVYTRDELYSGPAAGAGPDLVCIPEDGFDLKGSLRKTEVFGVTAFRGMHTRHDAHCILPDGARGENRLHIEEIAGIVLKNLSQ